MSQIATPSARPKSSPAPTALHRKAEELLARAGIEVNGPNPWDIQLKAPDVLDRALSHGSLGLGESYMDGEWEAGQLDAFFARLLRARLHRHVKPLSLLLPVLRDRLVNRQNVKRAWQVGQAHYDLGNAFYEAMLDPRLTYSCGYWKRASTLAEAQERKLNLICRKLRLEPGMRVLDIGCGWGSFMAFAAEHYGVRCVGVTVSKAQAQYIQQAYPNLPLEVRVLDYRDVDERFERIVSVGMFEHVGPKNYRTFMERVHRCLDDDGIFLLHTIGRYEERALPDPWIDKYIFPNGVLPALGQIVEAADGLFVTEDLHNFGADYDPTLMAWYGNFEASWPRFASSFDERFHRQWRYYLLSCAGAFRARQLQLWQWVFAKHGLLGGYRRAT